MHSIIIGYFAKGLSKILGKSKFGFWFLNPISKDSGAIFKIARSIQRFLSLVVYHLTIFDPLIQRCFSSFSKN